MNHTKFQVFCYIFTLQYSTHVYLKNLAQATVVYRTTCLNFQYRISKKDQLYA